MFYSQIIQNIMEIDKLSKKYCSQCGRELKEYDNFCPDCGTKNQNQLSKTVQNSNKEKKVTKKQILIIGVAIIIGLFIIITIVGTLTAPSANITDITVEKDGKLYQINYTYTGDGDEVRVALYKDNTLIVSGEGGSDKTFGNQFFAKLDKNINIDTIRFTVYDSEDNHKLIYNEEISDFNIIKVKNLEDPFDDSNDDETYDTEYDDYEIAKSHRDLYDYDGDGFLNDYEFEQFCKGEGQEELLEYN